MRKFTTPTLNVRIFKRTGEPASDLLFEYLLFTLDDGKTRIDKRIEFAEFDEGTFKVRYTQEETGSFSSNMARSEINFFNGETRLGTLIKTINLAENLINEVI